MKDFDGTDISPAAERRESVLEPGNGATGTASNGSAANIREQQGNSAGGMVPASFTGNGDPSDPAADRHPEDAANGPSDPDTWDSEG